MILHVTSNHNCGKQTVVDITKMGLSIDFLVTHKLLQLNYSQMYYKHTGSDPKPADVKRKLHIVFNVLWTRPYMQKGNWQKNRVYMICFPLSSSQKPILHHQFCNIDFNGVFYLKTDVMTWLKSVVYRIKHSKC